MEALEGLRVITKNIEWVVAATARLVVASSEVTRDGGGCPQGLPNPRPTLFIE